MENRGELRIANIKHCEILSSLKSQITNFKYQKISNFQIRNIHLRMLLETWMFRVGSWIFDIFGMNKKKQKLSDN